MSITAEQGPKGAFGQSQFDSNPEAGPSFWYQGDMMLDPRQPYTYTPGQRGSGPTYGWPTIGAIPIIDQSPSTASATNIANAAAPVAGTPLTLVSASGAGVTVGCTITNYNGQAISGLLGLDVSAARTVTGAFTNGSPKITFTGATMQGVQVGDRVTLTTSNTLPTPFALLTTYYVNAISQGAMMLSATPGGPAIAATSAGTGTQTINVTATGGYYTSQLQPFSPAVVFGQGGTGTGGPIRYWNPSWAIARCVAVVTNADDTGGFYTINGYDYYGEPMSQKLTGVSSGTVTSTKAFKYISSVVPSGTINSTAVNVGTVDVFGLPLRTDNVTFLNVYWNAALIAPGSVTFVGADIQTAIATSGDVRGTVYGGSASDNTKRLTVFWNPLPANMTTTVGLLGQQQA